MNEIEGGGKLKIKDMFAGMLFICMNNFENTISCLSMNNNIGNQKDLINNFPRVLLDGTVSIDVGTKLCAICSNHYIYCWDDKDT